MSKPEGVYWTCRPTRHTHDRDEMVEPWRGNYVKKFGEDCGTIYANNEWAGAGDEDVYEKASDAWLAYAEWTRDRECHYADEHDRAVTRLQEARKDESDAAKMKEILGDQ